MIKLKEKNFEDLTNIINKTPAHLRPILQNSLAQRMADDNNPMAYDLFDEVRKNISKVQVKPLAAEIYLEMVGTYSAKKNPELPVAFGELVKVINESDSYSLENKSRSFGAENPIIQMPAELPEIDEGGTFSSLGKISSKQSRTRLLFGLIESSLGRYKEKMSSINSKPDRN